MTTMSIGTFLRIARKLPATSSVLLRGDHGIGKSQVIRQLGELIALDESLKEYEVIDRRLSQMSEGDMIGLPSTDGEVTRFNPPDWFKRACVRPCVLLLDELNRGTHEVVQAAFQIVLDRELNGWKLHERTRVYAAINSSAAYNVNEIDPALLDRFWCIDLQPTEDEWITWARQEEGGQSRVDSDIVDFIAHHNIWLDPPKNGEPQAVSPSRRSWDRLSIALRSAKLAGKPEDPDFYPMCLGFIGTEGTIAFTTFCKNLDSRVTGEEIINSYAKVRTKVQRLGQERQNAAIDKLAEYCNKELTTLTDKQGKNLNLFMKDLPAELRVSCWAKLTQDGITKMEMTRAVHKHCVDQILDVFGVPRGEAGIGITPNIPGVFQQEKK